MTTTPTEEKKSNDLKPFVHGEEGTHTACQKRLNTEGGRATCCYCTPHNGCELATPPEAVNVTSDRVGLPPDIVIATPPETGMEWEKEFDALVKEQHENAMEKHYGGVWCTFERNAILSFIHSIASSAHAEGAKAERERIRKAMMIYKCKFVADKNSYVSVKNIFKVLDALKG